VKKFLETGGYKHHSLSTLFLKRSCSSLSP